jgi:predicted lysophospholipase L1 biosynthesis ABC-type transport system permease subunit
MWKSVLSAWPVWAPIAAVVVASLITRLTPYPRAGGVVTGLRVLLDVLSVLTHKDSPRTLQLPLVQRSQPPEAQP